MTPLRVGVWCAVSSRPQADHDKDSLPAQRRAGEEFARAVGGQVVAVYEVPGHTRDYWSWYEAEHEMPAYRQVREDLQAGKLDLLHCLDVDRLGRDPALIHQFYSLAEKNGCEVYDASMPHVIGKQSMGHRYGMSVKSVSAGEDQRRRVARHRMGMRARARRGLHPGRWPLGYDPLRNDAGEVIGAQFDDLIGAVDLMTRLFLAGHSYDRIARAVAASVWILPDGRQWHEEMVRRTLQNDVYAGYVCWGDARNDEPSEHFPALWDRNTYAAVLRERERRNHDRHRPHSGPLSGIVICHRCGAQMGRTEMVHRPGEYYLRWSRHAHRTRWPGNDGCHPNHIAEVEVMGALSAWLAQLATVDAIEEMIDRGDSANLEDEIARVEARLAELGPKRRRLALAYADGKMDLSIYYEADGDLRDAEDTATKRLAELRTMLAARPDPEVRRRHIKQLLDSGLDLARLPADDVGAALHRAGVRVYVEDREVLFCAFAI
jgi:DNA invertase Pin-like site-specific DNA recombinase